METKDSETRARIRVLALCGLTVFLLPVCAYAGPVTFFDGTFNSADWELMIEVYGNGGTVNVSQRTGGNPGEYRHIVNRVYGAPSACWGFHKCITAVYDPQTQGAIASIDYSEDSIMFSGFGEGQATAPALLQDGLIYYYRPYLRCNSRSWTTQSLKSLSEEDFDRFPWTGSSRHPDFSPLGNPIVFGFWRGNSTAPGSLGYTIVAGIDNWSITVTPSDNEGPITSNVVATPNPVAVNTDDVMLTATVDDSTTGNSNIASAEYGQGESEPTTWSAMDPVDSFDSPTEDVTVNLGPFSEPGVHKLWVRGTDSAGNMGEPAFGLLVVYDPSGGFVTGGGWIYSEAGSYEPNPSLEGKANFGFVSKYKKGATAPTGQTEFVFQTADLNFHSSSYYWLVVTGSDYAMFKGVGTVNGLGEYKFRIWAGDGDPDTFRIKIWTESTIDEVVVEDVLYDNDGDQTIGGGSIIVHTSRK